MGILPAIGALTTAVRDMFVRRSERKQAKDAARAKIQLAAQQGSQQLELNDQEWEAISQQVSGQSWKDEYVTVSVVSIVNLVVGGGIAAAFGIPQVLEGVVLALQALTAAGVEMGYLITATVLAALGLHIKRNW